MSRKIIIGVLAVLVLASLILVLWLILRAEKPAPAPPLAAPTSFFPAGEPREVPGSGPPAGEAGEPLPPAPPADPGLARFVKIFPKPVAEITVASGTSSAPIFVEKATGHLYTVLALREVVRLSNTTIPRVYEAAIGRRGNDILLLLRTLKNNSIENLFARLPDSAAGLGNDFIRESQPMELVSTVLAANLTNLVFSPRQDQVFYLERTAAGVSGYVTDPALTKKPPVFTSPLSEWQVQWPATTTLALTTKASRFADGLLYLINAKTGENTLAIDGAPGLITLVGPDGNSVLYSASAPGGLVFGLYDLRTQIFGRLPVATLASKCVWDRAGVTVFCAVPALIPPADYPDDWYRGEVGLEDNIWRINVRTKEAKIIFNPRLANVGEPIDAAELVLAPDGQSLYLVNKYDRSIWWLDLREEF